VPRHKNGASVTTVLLTLGRLPKALDLARGFAEAGCRVIVAEPFGWTLAGVSRSVARAYRVPRPSAGKAAYLDALSAIIAREKVDLVVPVSEETMHVAFLRDRIDPGVRLFTMPPDQVLALHDKASFVRRGREIGVAVPETYPLGSPEAVALAEHGRVVVKPVFSCSGRGVGILPKGAKLPPADPRAPAIVQAFIPGREHSSCTVALRGKAVSTVVYRGAQMSGTVAVSFERVVDQPAITAWIDRFVAATGWTGFISFDFIVDETGKVYGIECNPRSTSGVHFWQCADVARAILSADPAAAIGMRPERELQQFYSCLTETQKGMFKPGFGAKLKRLFGTKDVTWSARDPVPFLTMTFTSWRIIHLSIIRRATFGEVATLDVGWYED
jgi:predicted ATP-grasp superfamily ATP-dependent carboligase